MRRINLYPTVEIADGKRIEHPNAPVVVYDTSGPYTDPAIAIDINKGLPRDRMQWKLDRDDTQELPEITSEYGRARLADSSLDKLRFPVLHKPRVAKNGHRVTQMHYARKGIITPEMEYVAIRENLNNEALGIESYITPEFVRDEVAAGRAVIASNINHPEAEPMIIGSRFAVKLNTNIGKSALSRNRGRSGKSRMELLLEEETLMGPSTLATTLHETREWIIRNCCVPVGTVPISPGLGAFN